MSFFDNNDPEKAGSLYSASFPPQGLKKSKSGTRLNFTIASQGDDSRIFDDLISYVESDDRNSGSGEIARTASSQSLLSLPEVSFLSAIEGDGSFSGMGSFSGSLSSQTNASAVLPPVSSIISNTRTNFLWQNNQIGAGNSQQSTSMSSSSSSSTVGSSSSSHNDIFTQSIMANSSADEHLSGFRLNNADNNRNRMIPPHAAGNFSQDDGASGSGNNSNVPAQNLSATERKKREQACNDCGQILTAKCILKSCCKSDQVLCKNCGMELTAKCILSTCTYQRHQ